MFRKIILAAAATAAIGAAALTPTTASAWGWHGGWHRDILVRPAVRVAAPLFVGGGCIVRRLVATPFGPRLRWVNRCY